MTKIGFVRPSTLALVSILMASGLAGCDDKKKQAPPADSGTNTAANEALPMPLAAGPETAPVAAPSVAALPAAPRPRIARVASAPDSYAYLDRAHAMSNAIGEAPPDYGFDYQGVHPWVWRTGNGSTRLVEPVDGGERYYFYRSGASEPYLVSDPSYSYGYSGGQLVTVYDREGRLLPPDLVDRRADDAGRYLARAVALYEASVRSERRSVNAANWAARRAEMDAERAHWEAQQNQQDAWRAYHAGHDAEEQSYWQSERARRDQSARAFNDWRDRNFDGPPPAPAPYAGQGYRRAPPSPADARDGRQPDAGYSGQDARGYPPGPGYDSQGRQSQSPGPQAGGFQNGAQQPQGDGRLGDRRPGPQTPGAAPTYQGYPPRNPADAGGQAQARAAADAVARQQAQADAANAQQKAQADAAARAQAEAAKQAQAKAAADAAAKQQQAQADAARAQQKAQADAAAKAQAEAAKQAQAKAAADAAAKQQQAQADAARAQQKAQADAAAKAQADAAQQAQAKAAADAAAKQQQAQADAARAQQKAQADAAAKAAAAQQPAQPVAGAPPAGQKHDHRDHAQSGHSPDDKKVGDGRPKDPNDATSRP